MNIVKKRRNKLIRPCAPQFSQMIIILKLVGRKGCPHRYLPGIYPNPKLGMVTGPRWRKSVCHDPFWPEIGQAWPNPHASNPRKEVRVRFWLLQKLNRLRTGESVGQLSVFSCYRRHTDTIGWLLSVTSITNGQSSVTWFTDRFTDGYWGPGFFACFWRNCSVGKVYWWPYRWVDSLQ